MRVTAVHVAAMQQRIEKSRNAKGRISSRPSRKFPRTKRGCFTCRERKKKCTETFPRCAGCERNRLECRWPQDVSSAAEETAINGSDVASGKQVHEIRGWHRRWKHNAHIPEPPQARIANNAASKSWLKPKSPGPDLPAAIFGMLGPSTLVTSNSGLFLRYYLANTGSLLAAAKPSDNPFITYLVPLAYEDDLIMHCLMAMGGAHLGSCCPESQFLLERDASIHYARVVSGLRGILQEDSSKDLARRLRILTVVLLAAEVETVSRSCISGGMFIHLKAARALAQDLRNTATPLNGDEKRLLTFTTEALSFLSLVNFLDPARVPERRPTDSDEFISTSLIDDSDGFGSIFNGLHGLIELLPEITDLWSMDRGQPEAIECVYNDLRRRITTWNPPRGYDETQIDDHGEWTAASMTWRHALNVYLEAAKAGSEPTTQEAYRTIQDHVYKAALLTIETNMVNSRHGSTLSWPMIIMGSCLQQPAQRNRLVSVVSSTRLRTWNAVRALELMQLLWQDDDEKAFGPYGLILTMRKHGLNYSVA